MTKKFTKIMALSLAVVMGVLPLTGCGSKGGALKEGETVKIAFLNPLSGNNADSGKYDLEGAELAVKHINEAGGIKSLGGAQIELIVSDTTSDATQAKTITERTFTSNKLVGAVGTGFSGLTMPILPLAEKYQVPLITNSINDDITNQDYQFIFQTTPKGSMFGETQVEFLKYVNENSDIDVTKVGIVYENSAYGSSTAKGIREIAEKAGLEVVMDESYPQGFTDASSLVTSLKSSGAQAIFPVAYTTDAKLILNTMESMNYDPLVVGGGAGFLWPVMKEELGESVEGLLSVCSWNWDSNNISGADDLAAIAAEYEDTYGYYMTEHSGPTYIAVQLIADALEIAGEADPIAVQKALREIDVNSGPSSMMQPGKIAFDETGANIHVKPVMIQWQNGQPRTVYPIELATEELILPTAQ